MTDFFPSEEAARRSDITEVVRHNGALPNPRFLAGQTKELQLLNQVRGLRFGFCVTATAVGTACVLRVAAIGCGGFSLLAPRRIFAGVLAGTAPRANEALAVVLALESAFDADELPAFASATTFDAAHTARARSFLPRPAGARTESRGVATSAISIPNTSPSADSSSTLALGGRFPTKDTPRHAWAVRRRQATRSPRYPAEERRSACPPAWRIAP